MRIYKNFSLKYLNRIQTGGRALYFIIASTISDIKTAIQFSREKQLPYYVLGNGSNVLISDEDFEGIVIKLNGDLKKISLQDNKYCLTAGAGASLMKLGLELAKQNHLGYAYMALIPGTIGGAVVMNAGTSKEGEIKDHFLSALILNPEKNELREYGKKEMAFDYRKSLISNSRKIILKVTFKLSDQNAQKSKEALTIVEELRSLRRATQPKNTRNFGSTFKHPAAEYAAGWYLEKVGMKGIRKGGAMVAQEHANWILNIGNALSQDVKELIEVGQKRVFEEFGIYLEREVFFLPEDIEA
jgi:UDP-N-acetylmuramate dehydrogenase